jgi:hypothetical protein
VGQQPQGYDREFMRMNSAGHTDRMVIDAPEETDDEEDTTPWGRLGKEIREMGFDMNSDNLWYVLGLQRMEGPANDRVTISKRAGIIDDKLASIADARLEPRERAKKAEWINKIAEAQAHCLEELPSIQMERKKLKVAKDRLPRWAEATTAVSEYIMEEVEHKSVCMLNMSNLLRSAAPRSDKHEFAPAALARDYVGRLIKGGQETVDALEEMGDKGVVMWCPDSKDDIGRIVAGLAKATGQGTRAQITLVIPLEPRPGCHKEAQFMDTWTHELLSNKWAPFIEDVRFSSEPVKIVISGLYAPMHQVKSLCLVTLCSGKGAGRRGMMKTRGTIGAGEDSSILIVDIKEEDEVEFLVRAGRVPLNLISEWHGPTRAASTSKDGKRIVYTGNLTGEGAWAARVSLMQVKEYMDMEATVGLHSTFGNKESILVDITSAEAAYKIQELVEDAVLVTPRLMLVRSAASEAQWQTKVSEIFAHNDNAYVERVRYRPSTGGGCLAEAPALKEQKDRKRYEAKGSNGKELQMVLRLGGEFIGARAGEAKDYMKLVGEAAQIPMQEEPTKDLKEAYQWALMVDARYGWRGDILMKFNTMEEVLDTYANLEGKAISVAGGGRIVIEMVPNIALLTACRGRRGTGGL